MKGIPFYKGWGFFENHNYLKQVGPFCLNENWAIVFDIQISYLFVTFFQTNHFALFIQIIYPLKEILLRKSNISYYAIVLV